MKTLLSGNGMHQNGFGMGADVGAVLTVVAANADTPLSLAARASVESPTAKTKTIQNSKAGRIARKLTLDLPRPFG